MSTLIQDLRYGARAVVHHPGFSLIIVLTLALAIGANTVAFSFTNILVVRPLPVRDQEIHDIEHRWFVDDHEHATGTRGLVHD